MDFETVRLFVKAAQLLNITGAGRVLGLAPAVASARLAKLETDLGVQLLQRTTRKVSLSADGQAFLPHAKQLLAQEEIARAAVGGVFSKPKGTLRVTAPASFGRLHLVPSLVRFMELHPAISVDLRLTDTMVDLIEGSFDVAVRNAALADSSFIARKLAADRRVFCASPAYLDTNGVPDNIDGLNDHRIVRFHGMESCTVRSPDGMEHQLRFGGEFKLRTDNGDALRELTAAGAGISINALWSVYKHLKDGRLVQVLPDHSILDDASIWAVYPSTNVVTPKIRVFIDYYTSVFGKKPYWE